MAWLSFFFIQMFVNMVNNIAQYSFLINIGPIFFCILCPFNNLLLYKEKWKNDFIYK